MDTAKAKPPLIETTTRPFPLANLWSKVRSFHLFHKLQFTLIFPYMMLTLILAGIAIFIITTLLVASDQERFHNSMLDASRVANDGVVQQEKAQLDRLRFLIFADGMAQAMYDKNSDQIYTLMRPILTNARIDLMTAIDEDGREIATFGRDANTNNYHYQQGVDFSGVTTVRMVLAGTVDNLGDKYVELMKLEQGSILFTSAPVQDGNQNRVGVMMVGAYLDTVLVDIKKQSLADIVIVDLKGQPIATTFTGQEEGYENLAKTVTALDAKTYTQPKDIVLNGRNYQVAYSPLNIRGEQIGWIGVLKNSDYLVSPAAQSRQMFIILFTLGSFAVVIIGYVLARNISMPILKLRNMSQAVAAGNLNQSIGLKRDDEIGELAGAFDTMTLHLRERTEEAARLYEETLQRNRELAEINARLEATQLQLIQSEKLASIGQLTAGIVHDVKNPFAVIMGMAEVLGEDDYLNEETRHGLKVIRESAVKGNTIVSDLLKFARQSTSEMREADMCETVKTSMRLTAYLTRRFNTVADLPETPLYMVYDAQQVEQVLINMIHNAVQAMPNGGALRVSLKNVDGTAQISIQDSGCGISQEHLKRVFDPFFTTKPEGEGTGLGLSVSYGIIANHHGRIDVTSEAGVGTTFTIVLPLEQPILSAGEKN